MALLRDTETWIVLAGLLLNGYFTDPQEMKLQITIHPPAVKRVRVGMATC